MHMQLVLKVLLLLFLKPQIFCKSVSYCKYRHGQESIFVLTLLNDEDSLMMPAS